MAEIVIFGNYTREGFRLETNEPLAQQMLGDGLFRYGIGPAPCKSAKMEIGGVACPWWSQVEHDGVLLFCSNQDTSPGPCKFSGLIKLLQQPGHLPRCTPPILVMYQNTPAHAGSASSTTTQALLTTTRCAGPTTRASTSSTQISPPDEMIG
jgi:hypothetical protein